MSALQSALAKDINALLKQYSDESSPIEVLRAIVESAKLQEATLCLHERIKRDNYSLFKRNDLGQLSSLFALKLMNSSRVKHMHIAQTCSVYHVDATIEFLAKPKSRNSSSNGDKDTKETKPDVVGKKRKVKDSAVSTKKKAVVKEEDDEEEEETEGGVDTSSSALFEGVYLRFQYSETTVSGASQSTGTENSTDYDGDTNSAHSSVRSANANGDRLRRTPLQHRARGESVMEAPYKNINLIVSASRGAAGLQRCTVVDFQLLTAGPSPSAQQVNLQDVVRQRQLQQQEEEEGEEDEFGKEEEDEGGEEDEEEDEGGEEDEEEDEGGEEDEFGKEEEDEGREEEEEEDEGGEEEGEGGEEDCSVSISESRQEAYYRDEDAEDEDEGEETEEETEEDESDYYSANVSVDALRQVRRAGIRLMCHMHMSCRVVRLPLL
jgi:hypothetical protein